MRVAVRTDDGFQHDLGTAEQALGDDRVLPFERAAIANTVRTYAWFRVTGGASGPADAQRGVTVLLHSPVGPTAYPPDYVLVPQTSPVKDLPGARADVVLPQDMAVYTYAHLAQAQAPDGGFGTPAIRIGLADTAAALATRDWRLGENYFVQSGRVTSLRDVARPRSPKALDKLVIDLAQVSPGKENLASGVVSRTFLLVQRSLGWQRAEQLYAAVLADTQRTGGSDWQALARSLTRQAALLWPQDRAALRAVAAAARATHLSGAPAARSVPA